MRDCKSLFASCYWLAAFVLLWLSCSALGQTSAPAPAAPQPPKVMAPHRPIAPTIAKPKSLAAGTATLRSVVGGPWMTDANFKSSIYLKNAVATDPITVTPIVYLSSGKKYALPHVTLEPSGTAIVDINAGLEQ
jgi:hypothetical protein